MIAKGASRSGPRQLAVYLMRVERYETGEPVELLELKSPWAGTLNDGSDRPRIASRLIETFRDWQTLVEGTKQGRDGLYHAEISPEGRYAARMTPEQWKRAADILGEELGLQDQERAVVLHGGTDGRKHLHIVWARTDLDAMKLISDSLNYVAHERASKRMEQEFGQDFVPGKHAKRDRELQPEFPREELSQDEDQRQKRTGLKVAERKAEIAALHAAADNAQSFKAALEEAGYLLAKGERGYVVVDELGGHSVLSRNIGLKKKEVEAYMAAVDLNKLPTVEEAKALQKSVREMMKAERQEATAKQAEKPAPEAPKPSEKAPEAAPGKPEPPPIDLTLYAPKPQQSKFLPPEMAKMIEPPAPVPAQAPSGAAPIDLSLYAPKPKELPPPAQQQAASPPAPEIDLSLYAPKKVKDEERALKEHVQGLKTFADSAMAFKAALEEAGFTLARGKWGYLVVDQDGQAFGLAGLLEQKKASVDAYMSPVPLDTLRDIVDIRAEEKQSKKPAAPAPAPEPPDEELAALKKAIGARQAVETRDLVDLQTLEVLQKEAEHDREFLLKMANYTVLEDEQKKAFVNARKESRTGLQAILDAIERRWNPALAAEKTQKREKERQDFYRVLAKERADYEALLHSLKKEDVENLIGRQGQQVKAQGTRHKEEETRYVREYHDAKRVLQEQEDQRKKEELDKNESMREGPPPPRMGK